MKTFDELKSLIERRGVHAEFGEPGEGWGIEQSPYELATFLVRMQELGVQSCLEIGTGYKGGLSRFLAADMGWQVTTVDVVDYGHKFEGVTHLVTQPELYYGLGTVYKCDFLFIDGNHRYGNVKSDYENYSRYALKAIAFHDIMGLRGCEGVRQFWSEIKAGLKHSETMSAMKLPLGAGIGWIEL